MDTRSLPLFEHALESPSAFTPDRLMAAVRAERALAPDAVPPLCVLDFDGDLSDYLAAQGISSPWTSWACFHTSMCAAAMDGFMCGIVPRTIGGPYAVLVAEQLWVCRSAADRGDHVSGACISEPPPAIGRPGRRCVSR